MVFAHVHQGLGRVPKYLQSDANGFLTSRMPSLGQKCQSPTSHMN